MLNRLQNAIALAAMAAAFLTTSDLKAASFYEGKTLKVIIGYGAGGGYDLYGRLFARFFGKHLPGNPTIIAQNMPGAGSFKAAKFIHTVAPKNGTVFGSVAQTLALDAKIKAPGRNIDLSELVYIGRLTNNIDVGIGLPGSKFKTFEDARKQEIIVGVTARASNAVLLPTALKVYGGAKFKLVRGYKGTRDILFAAERGEVQLVGGLGLPVIMSKNPHWILEKKASILYQNALARHKLLPEVPTLPELGLTSEGKAVLRAIASMAEVGRSILTTPGVPSGRLALLRKAFQEMVKDPEMLAFVKKRNIQFNPASADEITKIVRETTNLPGSILDKIGALQKIN